jgi:UDP-glucose 6-dehydrogenase
VGSWRLDCPLFYQADFRWTLIKIAQDYDVPTRIVEAVLAVNETRKRAMAVRLLRRLADL